MSVILRVDDFPGTKPEEFWKHNLDNFKAFHEVVSKYVPEYILGVIPRHTTPQMVDYLESTDGVRVALHGVDHDERFPNEFREHETKEDIFNKLVSARQPFQKCNGAFEVTDYIPPHNVVDNRTLDALKLAGFRRVLCGPGTMEPQMGYGTSIGLNMRYSSHPTWYGRSDEMLVSGAPRRIKEEAEHFSESVLTIHWPWEWNIGLQHLDTFLHQISEVF